jgi:tetratricopeptide (TPR) repeat protein
MTVAAKESFGIPKPVGKRASGHAANPWRRLWQVPLLLAGLACFGLGVRTIVRTIKPVPFAEQVAGIRSLLENEKYDTAIDEINRIAPYYAQPAEQGALQVLAGDAHYLVQQKQSLVRENYERVLEHYERAVALGIAPDVGMSERWGVAALALGKAPLAVEKLEAAAAASPQLLQVHARELVNAYAGAGQLEKARAVLNRLLAEADAPATAPAESGHDEHAAGESAGTTTSHASTRAEVVDNKVWALCKELELAIAVHGSGGEGLRTAIARARAALKDLPGHEPAGRVLTWIGRGELQHGDLDAAQRTLAEARGKFLSRNLDDGRAAVLLAKIAEARGDLDTAGKLYEELVASQSGTVVWAAARLGRADVEMRKSLAEKRARAELDDEALGDYRFAIAAVKDSRPVELISRESVGAALVTDFERAAEVQNHAVALSFLALQAELGDPETEATAFRLATTRERRADELLAEASTRPGTASKSQEAEARALYARAAADYQRHARLATMQDDLSGDSLWKAAQLFDKAGEPMKSVALYEQFTRERPRDSRLAESLLATGRLYQSAGMFGKAIPAYERNMRDNAKTPAAYTSAVGLARCYMALADASAAEQVAATRPVATAPSTQAALRKTYFDKAEAVLLSLVQNNTDLLPAANEFRVSLFTLGELYFRNGRWADAILRLEEAAQRYPHDAGLPRALFLLAESYRKSAGEIGEAIRHDPGISGRDALEAARADRLAQAAVLFTRVIGLLDPGSLQGDGTKPGDSGRLSPLEAAYVRMSYMNRAACAYDRGDYAAAIKLYDEAATRFSEEDVAARAYVQIVNAYLALKEPTQAAAAAERGRWVLKRIPDAAFDATGAGAGLGIDPVKTGRAYYDRLLSLGKN